MKFNSKEQMIRSAERALKRTKSYQEVRELGWGDNYIVMCILCKGNYKTPENVIIFALYDDELITFELGSHKEELRLYGVQQDPDDTLFSLLEEGYEIIKMTMDDHYATWINIDECHGVMDHSIGMKLYLDYCKKNNVSVERLKEETGFNDIIDVMEFYDNESIDKKQLDPFIEDDELGR